MLCGIYGILPQVALWGKGKLCLKGTTQALMTHRSLQTFHENRKKTVVSREDKRVAEMRNKTFPLVGPCDRQMYLPCGERKVRETLLSAHNFINPGLAPI